MLVGILALQGDFLLHSKVLNKLDVTSVLVRKEEDFDNISALIIPGGESTVLSLLIKKFKLSNVIKNFSKNNCIYGTCAGAILLSKECDDKKIKTLNLINIKSFRNHYGRQINSFTKNINIKFLKNKMKASFIRAPKLNCLSDDLDVLGTVDKNPVLIKKDNILVSSFHPELTANTDVHKYFINMVNQNV